ncbi:MAG: hypothetical protein GKS05_13270 [Nitrospirales bacterium]|jgi:hypothetical protein|nr:hypothetical protein [Nitrospirales bacterium]
MKIVFKKDENSEITVFSKVDDNEQDFSYAEMIKALIESKVLGEPEISGNFTDDERKSITSMITLINKEIGKTEDLNSTA